MDPKAYRLPQTVLPRRYDIDIDARLGREDFFGKVAIVLDVRQPTSTIELHSRDLQLSNPKLLAGTQELQGSVELHPESEMARITFGQQVPAGEATLEIDYKGKVNPALEGLYLAKDGPEECLCTQCEENEARAIFPCFDEPTFKAEFAWRVTTDKDMTVIANGPLLQTIPVGDEKSTLWVFEPTKKLSSYLVALVIGNIASTEEEIVKSVPIRVWALKGKEQMGRFAHKYTARLLPYYERYFDVPYHFDKYDQAAVPGFSAGAMENAGLVTFRQEYLLMDPQTASWDQEKTIAKVVAHEFAHLWFGDLVTMKWWDDLWLNESFAEWMANKAVDSLDPDYHVWDDFQVAKSSAMSTDALENTHPIYTHVETPDQVSEIFDVITYQKGCAVMRMLENYLGEDNFRAGIRTYIKAFAEGNATGPDLWSHLQSASNQPVSEMMESWIKQPGYPVIRVALEGGNKLRLSQQRFFSNPKAPSDNNQTWYVPVVVKYEDDEGSHTTRALLSDRETTLDLGVRGNLKWLYANADEIGFYRQNLDATTLNGLLANPDKLSPSEQVGLLGDQWALVRNATNPITRVLDVLAAEAQSNDYTVLERVVGYLHTIENLLLDAGDQAALRNFRRWVGTLFQPKLDRLGYEPKEGESQNDTQSRAAVIDAMSILAENPQAIQQVTTWADREANNPASVDPNLAGTFVGSAAWFGDKQRFDRYVDIYKQRRASSASPQETQRYLYSLPDFRPPELVSSTLQLVDNGTLPQESIGPILRQMFPLKHAQIAAWDYVKSHWDKVLAMGGSWVPNMVAASGNLPASLRADIVQFFNSHLNGAAQQTLARALENIDLLAEFKARTRDDLLGWFKQRGQ